MNHAEVIAKLGPSYRPLSEVSGFFDTTLTIPGDGSSIGAYLVQAPNGSIRITDDSNTLFAAMVHGVTHTAARVKAMRAIAASCGVLLSDDGAIEVECDLQSVPYYVARFTEAADRIAYVSMGMKPKKSSRFERYVGAALVATFGARMTRNAVLVGASGHDLKFPFVVDMEGNQPMVIQPVPAEEGRPKWSNIYSAFGKLSDLKSNLGMTSHRLALVESTDEQSNRQATTAIAGAAQVVIVREGDDLPSILRRAA